MNIKFGVAHLVLACVVGMSGTAEAHGMRHGRYRLSHYGRYYMMHFHRHHHHHAYWNFDQARRRHGRNTHSIHDTAAPPIETPDVAARKAELSDLIAEKATAYDVPVALAHEVVRRESNYIATVTGRVGEIGLMQIKYSTARGIGYTGTREALYDPATNLEWGMRYLAGARKLADGDVCLTLTKYHLGYAARGADPRCAIALAAMAKG